jgi:hypothetical protein
MDLSETFRMTSACQNIRITSLKTDNLYPIERAEKVQTIYGEAVLLTLKESSQVYVKLFLPRPYGALFSEDDLKSINDETVSLALRYRGTCSTSNSYILEIE